MRRLPDWRGRLAEAVRAASARPFAYGAHDCAIWACDVVSAVTGTDLRAEFPGAYDTLRSGLRVLRAAGYVDHFALLAARFEAAPMGRMRMGDLVVVQVDRLRGIAMWNGRMALAVSPVRGLSAVDVRHVLPGQAYLVGDP
jgi:hypothetical protein